MIFVLTKKTPNSSLNLIRGGSTPNVQSYVPSIVKNGISFT